MVNLLKTMVINRDQPVRIETPLSKQLLIRPYPEHGLPVGLSSLETLLIPLHRICDL